MSQALPAEIVQTTHHGEHARHGYSLWEFDGTNWTLKKDRSANGATVGAPPQMKGEFRGQLRAIPSMRP